MTLAEMVRRIIIDPRKLTEYALDPESPRGRHKAYVFKKVLGFTQENSGDLLTQIEEQAPTAEATFHSQDEFGRRYTVDVPVQGSESQRAIVRTGWLIRHGADEAQLVTLYVKR
ncbi:MAG: hypothetical protein M5U01_40485 [Ardenticatenaceae bacterium]|nr:hypothetical protein [Ardenticatenaceae bacterium]